ncbi:hypothetical protein [Streptomyces hainanensis]|uniref:Uncharacterized protein n=1 Tax=Streptomyces hainanensis TaxID=402648 RepID=A0A4R4T6A0_9ACTN|nr:hypothetical protein [Streptomyces hainanensis]TDC72618.1 hypothetical protein E1283_21270 [Streptomyces hainanensis]
MFGFAADPRALDDLRTAPARIRDLALLALQDLVHGEQRGARLGVRAGVDLTGHRKLYVDPKAEWRIVYAERPAPANATHAGEIFLLAVGPRDGHAVYNSAAHRLGRTAPASSAARQLSGRSAAPTTSRHWLPSPRTEIPR